MHKQLQNLLNDERFMRRMQLAFHSSIEVKVLEDLTISISDYEFDVHLAFKNEEEFDRIYIIGRNELTTFKEAQSQVKAASLVQSHLSMHKDWRLS